MQLLKTGAPKREDAELLLSAFQGSMLDPILPPPNQGGTPQQPAEAAPQAGASTQGSQPQALAQSNMQKAEVTLFDPTQASNPSPGAAPVTYSTLTHAWIHKYDLLIDSQGFYYVFKQATGAYPY